MLNCSQYFVSTSSNSSLILTRFYFLIRDVMFFMQVRFLQLLLLLLLIRLDFDFSLGSELVAVADLMADLVEG